MDYFWLVAAMFAMFLAGIHTCAWVIGEHKGLAMVAMSIDAVAAGMCMAMYLA